MKNNIIAVLVFLGSCMYSQSARPKDIKDDPIIKERIANNGKRVHADIQVSSYFGLEEKIKALLVSNAIPLDCPTSQAYTEKRKYIEVLNQWVKDNQGKVKQDQKNKFISE